MKNQGKNNEAGFTLIEMLVSLFIFSLISVGTMAAMGSSLDMRDRVNQGMEELTQIQSARAIMRADFERLSLRKRRDILGSFEPYVLTTDGEALISFTRLGRENPGGLEPRGDAERIEYHFRDKALVRQSWPTANPNVASEPRELILLDELSSVRLEFLATDLVPITRIAIEPDRREALGGVARFTIVDEKQGTTQHIFELRG
jgi:general secretion pathway protein J